MQLKEMLDKYHYWTWLSGDLKEIKCLQSNKLSALHEHYKWPEGQSCQQQLSWSII